MFEFQVDSIDQAGHVLGRNGDRDIPVGTKFTGLRRCLVHKDANGWWTEDIGVVGQVCLEIVAINWYQRMIDVVPGGHTAGLAVSGDGLELLATELGRLQRHEYLSLVASETD